MSGEFQNAEFTVLFSWSSVDSSSGSSEDVHDTEITDAGKNFSPSFKKSMVLGDQAGEHCHQQARF